MAVGGVSRLGSRRPSRRVLRAHSGGAQLGRVEGVVQSPPCPGRGPGPADRVRRSASGRRAGDRPGSARLHDQGGAAEARSHRAMPGAIRTAASSAGGTRRFSAAGRGLCVPPRRPPGGRGVLRLGCAQRSAQACQPLCPPDADGGPAGEALRERGQARHDVRAEHGEPDPVTWRFQSGGTSLSWCGVRNEPPPGAVGSAPTRPAPAASMPRRPGPRSTVLSVHRPRRRRRPTRGGRRRRRREPVPSTPGVRNRCRLTVYECAFASMSERRGRWPGVRMGVRSMGTGVCASNA